MNILVTGGAGFIGRHLCKALENKGHNVHIIDKQKNGGNFHYRNGIHQINSSDLKNIDIVFHLAAYTDAKDSIKYPVSYFYNNVVDSIHLIEQCKIAKISRFIFASSAAVYGNTRHIEGPYVPIKTFEDFGSAGNLIDPYGASKMAVEVYLKAYFESYGLPYTALRLFNVYGPGNNKGVIYNFFEEFPPTINDNGKQVRDFIHVDDVVRAFIMTMEKNKDGIFNVGTGIDTNMNDLATMINDIKLEYKRRTPFTVDPYQEEKITMSIAQTLKSKNVLGFEAQIPLKEGLRSVAESIYK